MPLMASSLPVCNEPALLFLPLLFDESRLLTELYKSDDVVQAPVSGSSAESRRVVTVFDFVRIERGAEFLLTD